MSAPFPAQPSALPLQMFSRAATFHDQGRLWEAAQLYELILKADDRHFGAMYRLGMIRLQQSNFTDAERLFRRAVKIDKKSPEAHFHLAVALTGLDRSEEAIRHYEKLLNIKPQFAEAHNNLGYIFQRLGRTREAASHYEKALAIAPAYAEARNNLGNALQMLGCPQEAMAQLEKAIALRPNYAEAHNNLANVLGVLGRHEEAIPHYQRALAIRPQYSEAHHSFARELEALQRYDQALAHYRHAIDAAPENADAHNEIAKLLGKLGRLREAITHFERAVEFAPHDAAVHVNLGTALRAARRSEEAVGHYSTALALMPDDVGTLVKRANALGALNRIEEALADFDRALLLEPQNGFVFSSYAMFVRMVCHWHRTATISQQLIDRVAQGKSVEPFMFLGYCGDPAMQVACTKAYIRASIPQPPSPLWNGEIWRNERIRIAYLATGFHEHPNSYLTVELFEIHDRSKFDVFGMSLGPDDKSNMRARVIRAFDHFYDVRSKSDDEVATLLHELRVDILIDRSGYTDDSRPGIFARRPAPIQASYIGFPGSMGADFYDYIIADPVVLPIDQQPFFTEKIVHLPECYLVNDSGRVIAQHTPTRREVDLPEQGFVFCCFNNNSKIGAQVFDVWMRLLREVKGSVLWLLRTKVAAESNLRREAAARGVDPARLIFAERVRVDEHLARHRLADLFLDTLPYNAHTTASDALWTGLPVVTCRGQAFCGRVAASLLGAVGLPELVTDNLEDYRALALRLATEPELLRQFRQRLEQNRLVYPLFDTDRLRRHIEAAYVRMWELWQRGSNPRSFAVDPFPNARF